MDNERIAALRAEIKAKQAEIRRLRSEGDTFAGKARLAQRKTYHYCEPEWVLSYRVGSRKLGMSVDRYAAFGVYATRAEAVDAIPGIIEDLKALYAAAGMEDEHEG